MKEPTRLVDLSGDTRLVALLEAGVSEQPSDLALQRTLLAAAVGGGILGAAAVAGQTSALTSTGLGSSTALGANAGLAANAAIGSSAVAAAAPLAAGAALNSVVPGGIGVLGSLAAKGAGVVLVKWIGVGALGVASVLSAPKAVNWVRANSHATPSPSPHAGRSAGDLLKVAAATPADAPSHANSGAQAHFVVTPPGAEPEAAGPARLAAPLREPAKLAIAAPNISRRAESVLKDKVGTEVQLVEQSRNAIRSGSAARGLAQLDSYEAQYPEQQLLPEVLMLRLEALQRLGRVNEAQVVARRILANGAAGNHARQAREVLGQ